jgi:ubiquitin
MTIESSKIDTPVETIRRDDQCEFGKWLHGATLTTSDKATAHYKTVTDLHAQFHKTAARVVELALTGRKSEAETMMILGGEYAVISARLTQAMLNWKEVSK